MRHFFVVVILLAAWQGVIEVGALRSLNSHRRGLVHSKNFVLSRLPNFRCAVRSDEKRSFAQQSSVGGLIVGINKYSHDASVCIVSAESGDTLFCMSKERLTGRKNEGGAVGDLLAYALNSIGADTDDIRTVVSNNHHFRVNPFEKRVKNLYKNLNNVLPNRDYCSDLNLLPVELYPHIERLELSHHLAHAWSALSCAPFDEGLIVVMDGMGESYKAMMEDMTGLEADSGDYMHDIKILKAYSAMGAPFIGVPANLAPGSSYREAESAYVFDSKTATLRPVFKRWSRERSPSELYNHGFENMESIGAIYSRISSYLLGDWNACGKVMGLAPWVGKTQKDAAEWYFPQAGDGSQGTEALVDLGNNFYHKHNIVTGNPIAQEGEQALTINWDLLEDTLGADVEPNSWKEEKFGYLANVAHSMQQDLETVGMDLITSLREATGAKKVALTGGVALNSVLNGKVRTEGGYEQVHVSCCPGDEGIAVGCAMYGLQRYREKQQFDKQQQQQQSPPALSEEEDMGDLLNFKRSGVDQLLEAKFDPTDGSVLPDSGDVKDWGADSASAPSAPSGPSPVVFKQTPFSAYQGREFTEEEVASALYDMDFWIDYDSPFESMEALVADAAEAIDDGHVIAWVQGRSEFGQRALGARSILADPRNEKHRRFINEEVKEREWFRPLAPSVLDEHSGEWFEDLTNGGNASPYMSITTNVTPSKAAQVPAICHVDGSARLQTVAASESPLYHHLIEAFFKRTGVPMVLNTSFNRKGQPIVESPLSVIKTFLSCGGSIKYLYLGPLKISVKQCLDEELNRPSQSTGLVGESVVGNNDAPSEREGAFFVRAAPLYLSETTAPVAPVAASVDDPQRIRGEQEEEARRRSSTRVRIQDGGARLQDDITDLCRSIPAGRTGKYSRGADLDEGVDPWRTLPSLLHLEILQLLQVQPPSAGYTAPEDSTDGEITVEELFEALVAMSTVDYEMKEELDPSGVPKLPTGEMVQAESESVTWAEVKSALKWLNKNTLISFHSDETGDEDIEKLFAGADILDLRSMT